jgi:hypothetical protein
MTLDEQINEINGHLERLNNEFEYFLETDQLLSAAAAIGRIDDLKTLRGYLDSIKSGEDNETV